MNKYECLYILKYRLSQEKINETLEELKKCVSKVTEIKDYGIKDLAYPLNRNKKGHCFSMYFEDDNCNVLENKIRLDENVLKYMIIKS